MNVAVALLLCLAVVLAVLAAAGVPSSRVSLGWQAVACLAAAFAVPAGEAL